MTDQLTDADLEHMAPDDIVQAKADGRLDTLLGIPQDEHDVIAKARAGERLDLDDVANLARLGHPELVAAARAANLIDL